MVILITIAVLLCALIMRLHAQRSLLNKLSHKKTRNRVFARFSEGRFLTKYLMAFLSILALGYALSRPQREQERKIDTKTRDLHIVLDISASMLAQDSKPDRLTLAKEKIKKLVSRLKSERVSLIIFASDACIMCPLTHDFATFFSLLDTIDQNTISQSSTHCFAALQLLLKSESKREQTSKLMVLITDGEDFSHLSQDQTAVCKELVDNHIIVSCMTVGTLQGAPIPDGKGDFIKDESGMPVISKRDDTLAHRIAQQCNGIHVVADKEHDRDIDLLSKEIEKIEYTHVTQAKAEHEELYMYPATIALCACLIEWLL